MRYLRAVVNRIDSLESDDTFRRYFSFGLKCSGVLTLSVSILVGFVLLYWVRETPSLITGAILSAAIIIHFGIAAAMLYWHRARKITGLGQESHLTFGPILGVTGRLTGEIFCIFFITLGILALICSIFMPSSLGFLFPVSGIPGGFAFFIFILTGLILCFLCVLIAMFLLVLFYIMAEYSSLIGDIATNIKGIETILLKAQTTSASHEEIPSNEPKT